MTVNAGVEGSWAPDRCTLPTVEQPVRLAEFDALFASSLLGVDRVNGRTARLELRREPAVAARAADLSVRETQCCSFFEFAVSATGGGLTLVVAVPHGQEAVLAALIDRAVGASGSVGS